MRVVNETTISNAPSRRESDAATRQVAGWKFVRQLGKGGMAEVFEVEDSRLGTRAALKLFSCAKDKDGEIRARFLAEGALLARLCHPRLVRVFDYGIDPASDRPYFVMDLVLDPSGEPKTLADKEFGGADEAHVAMWYDDLRDALAFIHARGIVHRDVKLQNILVGPDGHAVLSDFGVAKIFDPSLREGVGLSPEETIHAAAGRRTVMGSLGYLAPELEMGVAASPASDYYALGVMVFYLLTGTWCEPRTDIAAALETYDPTWKEILPKLLHTNPSARECPSWRETAARMREADEARAEDALAAMEASLRKARHSRLVATIAAVTFGLIAVLAILNTRFTPSRRPPPIETTDICFFPQSAPTDLGDEMPEMDERKDLLVEAYGYVCEYVAKVNHGEMSRLAAADELKKLADDENSDIDDDVVRYLITVAASNILHEAKK